VCPTSHEKQKIMFLKTGFLLRLKWELPDSFKMVDTFIRMSPKIHLGLSVSNIKMHTSSLSYIALSLSLRRIQT
jgi:hypothetical protein